MGKYIALRSQDDTSITALPVFISRAFRHSMFYVREGSAIKRPEDLAGKRIGIPKWAQTAGIYGRGYLSDYVGLKLKLPEGIQYIKVPDNSLNAMLLKGELDAIMSARPPIGLGQGIVRLMPASQAAEQQYFKDTNIFPIMHSLVLKTPVLDANPWVGMNLYKTFLEAKNRSMERPIRRHRQPRPHGLADRHHHPPAMHLWRRLLSLLHWPRAGWSNQPCHLGRISEIWL